MDDVLGQEQVRAARRRGGPTDAYPAPALFHSTIL
jgi:hypothetical protein